MADKPESKLRYVPIVAALIAAASATASSLSSYYAFKGQTAAFRSTVFTAQYEATASIFGDVAEVILGYQQFIDSMRELNYLLKARFEPHAARDRKTEFQVNEEKGKFDDLEKNLGADLQQFERALRGLMRSLVRFSILFPDNIAEEMGNSVRQMDTDSRSLARFFSLENQAMETLASTDNNRLVAANKILEESEIQLASTQKSLDQFKTRMDAISPKIAKYLGIDRVAAEFRGLPPSKY